MYEGKKKEEKGRKKEGRKRGEGKRRKKKGEGKRRKKQEEEKNWWQTKASGTKKSKLSSMGWRRPTAEREPIREFRLHILARRLGPNWAFWGPEIGEGGPKKTQPISPIVLGSQN